MSGETLRHLEKQEELLRDVHNKMAHELHRLKVEEEMLMRKFYALSSSLGLSKKDPHLLQIEGPAVGGEVGMGESCDNDAGTTSKAEQQQQEQES